MGSQTLDILRQGVWASLTGGWFYDPNQPILANTFHLYVWLFLLVLPFAIHLSGPQPEMTLWIIYCAIIFIVFLCIKVINMRLHKLFDTAECIEEPAQSSDTYRSSKSGPRKKDEITQTNLHEAIELQDMSLRMSTVEEEPTPPVECSSRASPSPVRRRSTSHKPDGDIELAQSRSEQFMGSAAPQGQDGTFDLKVDVHSKPLDPGTQDHSATKRQKFRVENSTGLTDIEAEARPDDVVIIVDESPDHQLRARWIKAEAANAEKLYRQDQSMDSVTSSSYTKSASAFVANDTDPRRRFSNLSNLAQSLPSSSSCTSAFPVAGSIDLAAILNHNSYSSNVAKCNHSSSRHKRGGSHRLSTTSRVPTTNNSTASTVRRTQSALVSSTISDGLNVMAEDSKDRDDDLDRKSVTKPDSSDVEDTRGSQSPLINCHHSVLAETNCSLQRKNKNNSLSTSTRSLDKIIEGRHSQSFSSPSNKSRFSKNLHSSRDSNDELIVSLDPSGGFRTNPVSGDMDMETFEAEIQEATNALLDVDKYLKSCDNSESSMSVSRRGSNDVETSDDFRGTASSGRLEKALNEIRAKCSSPTKELAEHPIGRERRDSGPYLPMNRGVHINEQKNFTIESDSKDDAQSFQMYLNSAEASKDRESSAHPLESVEPLDWLYSDSEPEPPSSPKLVGQSMPIRQRAASSSQGSSGTDTETRTLLTAGVKRKHSNDASSSCISKGAIPKRKDKSHNDDELNTSSQESVVCDSFVGSEMGKVENSETALQGPTSMVGSKSWRRYRARGLQDDNEDPNSNSNSRFYLDDFDIRARILETIVGSSLKEDCERQLARLMDLDSHSLSERDPLKLSTTGTLSTIDDLNAREMGSDQSQSTFNPRQRASGRGTRKRHRNTESFRRRNASRIADQIKNDVLATAPGTHVAVNYEDTTEGAVHCFQDEFGCWHSYTFGSESTGTANAVLSSTSSRLLSSVMQMNTTTQNGPGELKNSRSNSNESIGSGLTVILDSPAMVFQPHVNENQDNDEESLSRLRSSRNSRPSGILLSPNSVRIGSMDLHFRSNARRTLVFTEPFDRTRNTSEASGSPTMGPFEHRIQQLVRREAHEQYHETSNKPYFTDDYYKPKVNKFYELPVFFGLSIKVPFDRLTLMAALDRNITSIETFLSIVLAVLVGFVSSLVLEQGYYEDLGLFFFCAVTASCQYSLIKSVQPDSASPTHGINRIVIYSRPIYFVLCCFFAMGLDAASKCSSCHNRVSFYGASFPSESQLVFVRDGFYLFILFFPVIFVLGLLPQINTFLMFTFEQIDIHIFGGNATSSLLSSVFCLFRSVLAVGVLIGFAYGGLTGEAHSQHTQEILFSIFCALTVVISYHLSRSSSDPTVVLSLLKRQLLMPPVPPNPEPEQKTEIKKNDHNSSTTDASVASTTDATVADPLPKKLRDTVNSRLKSDVFVCIIAAIVTFLLHWSGLFTKLQPNLNYVLWVICVLLGLMLHYVLPQLRKQLPWLCFSQPLLKSNEYGQFEVSQAAKVMWFEMVYLWLQMVEKYVVYPLVFLGMVSVDIDQFKNMPHWWGAVILVVTGLKLFRSSFSDCSRQYMILTVCLLFFLYDPRSGFSENASSEPLVVHFFVTSIIFHKLYEFYLKVQFVITYIAPWQITWGSAFHAFAQPFSVPHSAMLFLQAAISAIFSTPLNPILGSAVFITSYVRPVKFWERDYNTKRVDHSNTRLSSHLERNPGADDNNLNSIFYEHLTRSLQASLAGDIMLGRWGVVSQGDCFVLASDYLNCLVHIIELANGLVTFQVRGLEFRGTYCQQREVEAISEGVEDDVGFCCCEPGHLPHMLSVNAGFAQRWLAWEVSAIKYVLEGYSISDNSAQSILQVFDLRKVLINYYVKSIIYYTLRSPKLDEWLENSAIKEALKPCADKNFADLDPLFNANIDEDFDFRSSGITRQSFCSVYHDWIVYCAKKRQSSGSQTENNANTKVMDHGKDSLLVSLCFALSLMGRRALGAASHNYLTSVEFFLYGLHALFKGDFRITSVRDEWVFADMELLRKVVAPGIRMSVKLHQDHFTSPDEYDDSGVLFDAISGHEQNLVISHEGDPAWRTAVLSGAPSLLALRHVVDDGADEYKIIMLNKRHISFRVIKLNRECVRGLWAGQQQELIFLRNRNPERGSIQNAKQALRNIINSSCDQPIGYPIYVSPLTTSFVDTNPQVKSVIGGSISLPVIKTTVKQCWKRLWQRCGEGCSSGSAISQDCDTAYVGAVPPYGVSHNQEDQDLNLGVTNMPRGGSLPNPVVGSTLGRASMSSQASHTLGGSSLVLSGHKPVGACQASLSSFAGLLGQSDIASSSPSPSQKHKQKPSLTIHLSHESTQYPPARAKIMDPLQVYDNVNLGRRIDPQWPDDEWRQKGGRNAWKDWLPEEGMEGTIVHKWSPCHREILKRSHVDKTIILLKVGDRYVPIVESAIQIITEEAPQVPMNTPQSQTDGSPLHDV